MSGQQQMIECNGVGEPVYVDTEENKRFYESYRTLDLIVTIGDNVRIALEGGTDGEDFGFGQILAIYVDIEEEVFVEVRWYKSKNDLTPQHRKRLAILENEIFESDILDDVPAGSVCELIQVTDQVVASDGIGDSARDSSVFVCRFMETSESNAIQHVSMHSLLQRGLGFSHYSDIYANILESANSENTGTDSDEYSSAIKRLHISVIPERLPCRTQERDNIERFIRNGISARGCGKAMYISGMPGTGKTATVMSCINALRSEAAQSKLNGFNFIEINCLRLKTPIDVYTVLWRAISGNHCSPKVALRKIGEYFTEQQHIVVPTTSSSSSSSSAAASGNDDRNVIVCLVDELDYLATRDFTVLYNFLNWPLMYGSGLVVVGIANAMDLPEQLSTRLKSRLDISVERIVFKPYSFSQIAEILNTRLKESSLDAFDPKVIEFLSRKVSSVAGDLRAALKICQHTIELQRDRVRVIKAEARTAKSSDTYGGGALTSSSSSSSNSMINRQKEAVESILPDNKTMSDYGSNSKEKGAMGENRSHLSAAAPLGSINTSRQGVDAVPTAEPHPQLQHQLQMDTSLVKLALERYQMNPFIATIARCCQLDKAILIILSKHRLRAAGGDDGSGRVMSATVSSAQGMNMEDLWLRLGDLIDMKKATAKYSFSGTTTSSSMVNTTGASSGSTEAGVAAVSGTNSANAATAEVNNNKITLTMPTWHVFEMALDRIYLMGIMLWTNGVAGAVNGIRLSLHPKLMHSDIVAALAKDPMKQLCNS